MNKWLYSFEDEPVDKFTYSIKERRIEVYFSAYFDEVKRQYFEVPSVFIIEDWKKAMIKRASEETFLSMHSGIGIFSRILYMDYQEKQFEILVITLDDRCITLFFEETRLRLRIINDQI